MSDDDRKIIESAIEEEIKWLESNPNADTDEFQQRKQQIENIVAPIMAKLYEQGANTDDTPPHSSNSQSDHDDL